MNKVFGYSASNSGRGLAVNTVAVAAMFVIINLYLTGNLGLGASGGNANLGVAITLNVALFAVTVISPLKDSLQAFKQLKTSLSAA